MGEREMVELYRENNGSISLIMIVINNVGV